MLREKGCYLKWVEGSFDIYPVNSESPAQSWREAQAVWNVEDRCKEPGLLARAFAGSLLREFQNSEAWGFRPQGGSRLVQDMVKREYGSHIWSLRGRW